MARPSYLSRRPDGRYCIQIRLGKRAAAIYGRPLLRVSLRTSDFAEARRRLVDNLEWVVEVVEAPDLRRWAVFCITAWSATSAMAPPETKGGSRAFGIRTPGRTYRPGPERGYLFARHFPGFANCWAISSTRIKPARPKSLKTWRAAPTGPEGPMNGPRRLKPSTHPASHGVEHPLAPRPRRLDRTDCAGRGGQATCTTACPPSRTRASGAAAGR